MAEKKRGDKTAKIAGTGNIKKLISYAGSSVAAERAAAAGALGGMKSDDAYNALISLLRDQDTQVRISAVGALAQAGRRDAVEHIRHVQTSTTDAALLAACADAIATLQTKADTRA